MPAIFLDRDGTINEKIEGGYVTSWPCFRFLPDARDALQRLTRAGYRIIVVSNQAAVGKRLMSEKALEEITTNFRRQVDLSGGRIDEVFYCVHAPLENCDCRKPKPGLLLRAAAKYGIRLDQTFFVGDSDTDVLAGQQAGCRTIRIRRRTQEACQERVDFVVDSLSGAVDLVFDHAEDP